MCGKEHLYLHLLLAPWDSAIMLNVLLCLMLKESCPSLTPVLLLGSGLHQTWNIPTSVMQVLGLQASATTLPISLNKEDCVSEDRIKMPIEFASSPFTILLQVKNSNINRQSLCSFPPLIFIFFSFLSTAKISKQKKKKKIQLMKSYSVSPIICGLANQQLNFNDYTKHQALPVCHQPLFVPNNSCTRTPTFQLFSSKKKKKYLHYLPHLGAKKKKESLAKS